MNVDAIVIGAGIVGLAVARTLGQRGQHVIVLEREQGICRHASSRNSEVVHAGIYDPPTSLKTTLCLRGRDLLRTYCQAQGITLVTCGKYIVATDEAQHPALATLQSNAALNGVSLQWCEPDRLVQSLPEIRCTAALWSPTTAIIDSHQLAHSLLADAQASGADLAYGIPFERAEHVAAGWRVWAGGETITCRYLINSAGAGAHHVARRIIGMDEQTLPPHFLARGNYFAVRGAPRFAHLVYPLPVPGGLGVHITMDLAGAIRLGPDVEWIDEIHEIDKTEYTIDPNRADAFYSAIGPLWPGLRRDALVPAYAGVRTKVVGPGQGRGDFVLWGPQQHGLADLIHLFGIESPGLTASLALAEAVAEILRVG